ncbi:MAG: GGDEF domain-containing protein [Magnetococcales bacterium]|nr:GGDEF domain-containing protein [Magnetococcales bacterium]
MSEVEHINDTLKDVVPSKKNISFKKVNKNIKKLLTLVSVDLRVYREKLKKERSKRQLLESQLEEKERVLKAFTSCNEAIASAANETQFLNQICQLIVKSGGYKFVWVGIAIEDEEKSVKPVAQHGFDDGYLDTLKVSWGENKYGQGPTGKAIRSGRPEVSKDISKDGNFRPWKKAAIKRGFSSSLALPLMNNGDTVGALNLYARRKNAFQEEEIQHLENVALDISHGILSFREQSKRQKQEEKNQRSLLSKIAISALLETSLEPLSLTRQLEVSLDLILSLPWLPIEKKGSIFLADEDHKILNMAVQTGLAEQLLTICHEVSYGYCLCGRAAQNREIVFASHIDEHHEVDFAGIKDHGHYCVPIVYQDSLLGVLNLYIADGHVQAQEEVEFLNTIANTLAGLIIRKRVEEKVEKLARFDSLTNLPNRTTFFERLAQEVARSRRELSHLSILFMDLDRFKLINDNYGHPIGDELLVQSAIRIKSCIRENDIVARFGGDEFCILLPAYSNKKDAIAVAKKIVGKLNNLFYIKDIECKIGASIGISHFPDHGDTPKELIRKADIALYAVKNCGRNSALVYTSDFEMLQET